jgi:hypothetical protein
MINASQPRYGIDTVRNRRDAAAEAEVAAKVANPPTVPSGSVRAMAGLGQQYSHKATMRDGSIAPKAANCTTINFTKLELAGRCNDHPTTSRRTGCFFVSTSDVRVVRNRDPVAEPVENLANVG